MGLKAIENTLNLKPKPLEPLLKLELQYIQKHDNIEID